MNDPRLRKPTLALLTLTLALTGVFMVALRTG
jgi:hypothetical protein